MNFQFCSDSPRNSADESIPKIGTISAKGVTVAAGYFDKSPLQIVKPIHVLM